MLVDENLNTTVFDMVTVIFIGVGRVNMIFSGKLCKELGINIEIKIIGAFAQAVKH